MKSEDKIQQECVMWYRNVWRKGLIFHVPNQGKNMQEQLKKKAIGMLPGVSDLVVIEDGRVLFIEMKDDTGTTSETQDRFKSNVERLGYRYEIVRSLEQFKQIIES